MKEIFARKKELIKRDPIFHEFLKTFFKIIELRTSELLKKHRDSAKPVKVSEKSIKEIRESLKEYGLLSAPVLSEAIEKLSFKNPLWILGEPILENIEGFHKPFPSMPAHELPIKARERNLAIQAHQKKYPDYWNSFRLKSEVSNKWHVSLVFSEKEFKIIPYTHDEIIWIGKPPFDEYTPYNASIHYPQLHWTPYPNPFNKKPILADINEFVTPGYKSGGEWLPIIINTSRLKKDNAKKIKKLLWELIESNLQKETTKKPYDEYSELSFLYSLRKEDTFQKYLRWYDIHTQEKLSFRLIAHIDNIYKTNPSRASEVLEKFKSEKVKWGIPIKGEDKIEKGIKSIYKAIHRTDYSKKKIEPLIEEYSCPQHQKKCPSTCDYSKKWIARFNRLNPSN